jgi:ATPase subunit of ABC transporter with duplicated ATPase domains
MRFRCAISIYKLTYITQLQHAVFNNIGITFQQNKSGIVGNNGIGKSTLLKLIVGEIKPTLGTINIVGSYAYCPQEFTSFLDQSVANVLDIEAKLNALKRIYQGNSCEEDFAIVQDDWTLEDRATGILRFFGLDRLEFTTSLQNLSGGEITRLYLAKTFLANSDFIILDEPTNNLDVTAKQQLYTAIANWHKGLLVVSHDRQLLELMDQIIELNVFEPKIYGGNYSYYKEQSAIEKTAQLRQLESARQLLRKTKHELQSAHEKREQRVAQGKSLRRSGSQPKMALDKMKENSEQSQKHDAIRAKHLINNATQKLNEIREKIAEEIEFDFLLPNTNVARGKQVVCLENVTFTYDTKRPLIENFNLTITGPERVALLGANGSGKTTLVKLLLGKLIPQSGIVKVGVVNTKYLDQSAGLLDLSLTILDNFRKYNPSIQEAVARTFLAAFLFRREKVLQLASSLSGGEKLRALLACILMAEKPPQLIILDEPTNNLDLECILSLEQALCYYQGALLVISHDRWFLENIKVTKIFEAPFVRRLKLRC